MLTDAKAKQFEVLLVDDFSRLSRDSIETETARRRLVHWGVRLIGVSDGIDTQHEGHELLSGFKGIMNQNSNTELRKRIKRQRYAVEFFAPVLRRKDMARYLEPLTVIQDRMGELNDLFVARARYQALVAADPAAWFALGWLAARVAEVRALAKPELKQLAKADPPGR